MSLKEAISNPTSTMSATSSPVPPNDDWVTRYDRWITSIISPDRISCVFSPLAWLRGLKSVLFATLRILRRWLLRIIIGSAAVAMVVAYFAYREFTTSEWQAKYFSQIARESTFTLSDGANSTAWFPKFGPYDTRLGYTKIAGIVENLTKGGYVVTKQTRLSPRFLELANNGIFPPYREKTRSGITILDRSNTAIYSAHRPERVFDTFEMIPDIVVKSLLFIENREILDQRAPLKNPAVEWDRLALAVLEKLKQIIKPDLNAPGGSTIATQLEKYRHSNEGRTSGIRDKLLQMASASIRAYMFGEETLSTRKQIVLQYINSIPLAALPGYGEVSGLGDGLWAWYGLDFDNVTREMRSLSKLQPSGDVRPYAETYKKLLSLFIAHRRPSFYLLKGLDELNSLTNTHLDLFAQEGVISEQLKNAAKAVRLSLLRAAPKPPPISYVQLKAANAIRTRLLSLMKYPQLYDLDQVDLTVRSSIDNRANEGVTEVLQQIRSADAVKKLGLNGARSLGRGDPAKVIYSLTLYERVGNVNLLRVQTDNFDKPFSINEGTRLDLGSTAKLRTLVTYLDIIGEVFDKYSGKTVSQIRSDLRTSLDPISRFVVTELASNPKLSLATLLDKAMERRYSASTGERFFTGGGVHTFKNFKREDDGKLPTIQEALTHSLNLPMVRLMRDISRYYMHKMGIGTEATGSHNSTEVRMKFLRKFADQEGAQFIRQFAKKYSNQKSSDVLAALVKGSRASAKHAAVMYRYVRPNGSEDDLAAFIRSTVKNTQLSREVIEKWHAEFGPGKFSLNDQGYLARIHPLELWLVKYLQDNPGTSISKALASSIDERQEVYEWLFKTPHSRAQDIRIRTLVEMESFLEVHKQWKKVGYPFDSMVPSLASSIGSSGDRPAALAELVGIILNDGIRYPLMRLEELHFAADTPYETVIRRGDGAKGERVLKSEVAQTLRRAMALVVQKGTARRVNGTFKKSDGSAYVIGGKTGTGDHRHETYGPGGSLVSSRVVNRTATFAFYLGDRFFGVISAHVPGAEAAKFDFTSALAAELLKILSKALMPMIEASGAQLTPQGVSMLAEDNRSSQSEEGSVSSTPAQSSTEQSEAVQAIEPVAIPTAEVSKDKISNKLTEQREGKETRRRRGSRYTEEVPVILPPPI